jgi:NAD(P)-dependent dehydrogenase (short-subunit alcohol dehydrogenase family)
MVKTEGLDELAFITQEIRDGIAAMTPMRRIGEPEDIAAAAVLFCSDDARWITGQCIRVSGGLIYLKPIAQRRLLLVMRKRQRSLTKLHTF